MAARLCLDNLSGIADRVAVPGYTRESLSPGIVHIGVGNFHRAHQGVYLHRLFEQGLDRDWAIIGAGLKPYDRTMRETLERQDCLTTVVELDPRAYSAFVIGSMIDYAEVEPQSLISVLARPEIRIVSTTVTEGGYYVDARTGGFDRTHPDIVADAGNADAPQTVFGVLIAALKARREAGLAPFTVMSCDNLPDNGCVTRSAVLGLAGSMPGGIGRWIEDNVAFPNSMVDCITPATGDRERQLVRDRYGIEDGAPVVCEPFRQWVLEDDFPAGRPTLERVGVTFVDDVGPYELMKLWILNGGHAAIAYPSALLGYELVHEAMADPTIRTFLTRLERSEILPVVPKIPGVDFDAYLTQVIGRFSNSAVGDTIPRLCLDGSNRQPKFILPTIRARLGQGLPVDGLALEVALWCRYCAGADEAGSEIAIADENAETLKAKALEARGEPDAFLRMPGIFGPLADDSRFREAFAAALRALWANGTRATLEAYIAATGPD